MDALNSQHVRVLNKLSPHCSPPVPVRHERQHVQEQVDDVETQAKPRFVADEAERDIFVCPDGPGRIGFR